jgi:hypothetical protein
VEGWLGKAALAAPEFSLAGEEALTGERLVVLVAILEVVRGVFLEEIEDVIRVE